MIQTRNRTARKICIFTFVCQSYTHLGQSTRNTNTLKRHSDAKTQATLRDFWFQQHSYRGCGCCVTSRRVVHLVSPRVSKQCLAFIVQGINSPRFSLWTLFTLNDEGITLNTKQTTHVTSNNT